MDDTRKYIRAGVWRSAKGWRAAGRSVKPNASPRGLARAGWRTYPVFDVSQTEPLKRRKIDPPRFRDVTDKASVLTAIAVVERNVGRGWRKLPILMERGVRYAERWGWLGDTFPAVPMRLRDAVHLLESLPDAVDPRWPGMAAYMQEIGDLQRVAGDPL